MCEVTWGWRIPWGPLVNLYFLEVITSGAWDRTPMFAIFLLVSLLVSVSSQFLLSTRFSLSRIFEEQETDVQDLASSFFPLNI